jgi:uncharacterized protein (DUF302 family)
MRMILVAAALVALATAAAPAGTLAPRDGWRVIDTGHAYGALVARLDEAVKAAGMLVVTRASATAGANAAGITIPGNMVVGVYRNDFARRMLEASVAAGIEAPIRFYLTENADGTATLSYKTPGTVFAPYFAEGGEPLKALAAELDGIFEQVADEATQ